MAVAIYTQLVEDPEFNDALKAGTDLKRSLKDAMLIKKRWRKSRPMKGNSVIIENRLQQNIALQVVIYVRLLETWDLKLEKTILWIQTI